MRVLLALGLFGAGVVVLLVGFVVLNNVIANDEPTDCSTVELPEPGRWEATDLPDRIVLAGDLSRCSRYDGLTSAELTEAFGEPDGEDRTRDGQDVLIFVLDPEDDPGDSDEIRLFLRDDRVVDVDLVTSSGP